jgi:cytochrome c553
MHRSRRVTLALSLALFSAASIASCGDDEAEMAKRTGPELFQLQGCNTCHGANGEGVAGYAPTLHGKKSNWTRESLIAYFKDPETARRTDPRLKAQGSGYSLHMPTYKMLGPIPLEKLADHVLSMP